MAGLTTHVLDISKGKPASKVKIQLFKINKLETENNETLDVINPSNGELLCKIGRGSFNDIDCAVVAAQDALNGVWGNYSAMERGRVITKIGEKILEYILH